MKANKLLATALIAGSVLPGVSLGVSPEYGGVRDEAGYAASTLDSRVSRLEKRLSGQPLVDMSHDIERLQDEVKKLRGTVEELRNALDKARKQEKEHNATQEKRSAELEAKLTPLLPPPPPPVVATPTDSSVPLPGGVPALSPQTAGLPPSQVIAPAAAVPIPGSTAPGNTSPTPAAPLAGPETAFMAPPPDPKARQRDYEQAFETLKGGKYTDAIAEFQTFVAKYPTGEFSDNAHYWLGEAHYVNRDFVAAREAFRRMISDFPQSSKVPDADLKLAFIEYENQQYGKAKGMLQDLIKRYPSTSAAQMAQKRLERMKQENH